MHPCRKTQEPKGLEEICYWRNSKGHMYGRSTQELKAKSTSQEDRKVNGNSFPRIQPRRRLNVEVAHS